ncbi:helicase-related protein [Deferribacter abyssi]
MSNFITNHSEKKLSKRINTLITASNELKFLVGFFYFSGIRELIDSLKINNKTFLKILVGLNVDKINGKIIEVDKVSEQMSLQEFIENYLSDVKSAINNDEFDNKEFYEQVKFYIELIINDRVIIRKTREPNHAKLYLFKLDETQVGKRNLFITGSSNLTKSGLTSQNEFNVEISDYGFKDAEKYFDELWEDSVEITERNEIKKQLVGIIKNETLIKEITPFEAYCFVLKTYIDTYEETQKKVDIKSIIKSAGYKPYNYQIDAVKQALSIIEKHNGVIIADVVGLGKTVIACLIAAASKKRGIVICPPGLVGDENKTAGWKKYLEDFRLFDWDVRSVGKLEEVLDYVKRHDDIEMIIVDEAHRFRNQDTYNYHLLENICRNRNVVLLTATPFNNRPNDIFSLLKLFIIPKKSTITIDNNLEFLFAKLEALFKDLGYIKRHYNSVDPQKKNTALKKYEKIYGKKTIDLSDIESDIRHISMLIKNYIEPVTIRRNRLDLIKNPKYKKEIKDLSEVQPPIEWFYELTKNQSLFYDKVINEYFSGIELGGKFHGAIYRPFEYEKSVSLDDENRGKDDFREYMQQRNLFDFMRRMIVRRFESSFGAFVKSIENFLRIHKLVYEFIEKTGEYILDRSLIEKIYDADLDEIEEALKEYEEKIIKYGKKSDIYPKKHKRYKVEKFKNKNFLKDINEDILLFESILEDVKSLKLTQNDPKIESLIANIKKIFEKEPDRKVIIFSEFTDTVRYLAGPLNKAFNNRVLVVDGALGVTKAKEIYENFDASYEKKSNDYDILLCTDKISEGFNLNRAGIVINYDIPWNPVRVIQRLGRINRIGKKVFDKLYIVNFFPTEKGANIVKSREIAANKMFMIHNILGEDARIFDESEEISPSELYSKIMTNPEELEEESFYTKVLNKYEEIKKKYPQVIENIQKFPYRIKVAKKYEKDELLVFYKKNRLFVLGIDYNSPDKKIKSFSLEEVIPRIEVDYDEQRIAFSESFWDEYEKIKNYKEPYRKPTSELSIEKKAFNNIDYLLSLKDEKIFKYLKFLRSLKEDMLNYGTLSDYTLRLIANLDPKDSEKFWNELDNLYNTLGEDYLEKLKNRELNLKREIIIAIENRNIGV